MSDQIITDQKQKNTSYISFNKAILVMFYTPLVYILWIFLLSSANSFVLDIDVTTIVLFWLANILFFVLVFSLLYFPLIEYHHNQRYLNQIQGLKLALSSVMSVFICSGLFYLPSLMINSGSIFKFIANFIIFSGFILGTIGILQFWFSYLAVQLVLWIKSRSELKLT